MSLLGIENAAFVTAALMLSNTGAVQSCQELLQYGSHLPELCLHCILKCLQEVLLKVSSVVPTRWLLFGT